MSNIKRVFGASGQVITITLDALANGSAQQSTVVDNTSDLFLDALVQIELKTATGTPAVPFLVNVYAYATANNGSLYSDGASGGNAGITLTAPPNMVLIGSINTPAATTSYVSSPMSVAAAFGGVLPAKWGIVVENLSGVAFGSAGGDNSAFYQGVYASVV